MYGPAMASTWWWTSSRKRAGWCGDETSSPRRNPDQFRELLPRQRCRHVFEPDRIGVDGVDADQRVRVEGSLGIKAVARAPSRRLADPEELGIMSEHRGIRIHPVHGLAIGLHEALDRVLAHL